MPFALTDLFPDQDYRFHLTLRKGELAAFFATQDSDALAERSRWLDADPARYAVATADAEPLVREFAGLAASWRGRERSTPPLPPTPAQSLTELGRSFEPDFLLLSRNDAGVFILRAGVVCFPSAWALAEKIGLSLDAIHGIVPGLNAAMAPPIDAFLGRLKPGAPYERANWGLAATPELNLHPHLQPPRLEGELDPARTWVRIEDQILAALPATGGILFGIALRIIPLEKLLANPSVKRGFHRAVSTLPAALAHYKGLSAVLPDLVRISS